MRELPGGARGKDQVATARFSGAPGLAAALMRKLLSLIKTGSLVLELPSGQIVRHVADRPGPTAHIKLHNWRPLRRLAASGDIGLARSYIDSDWSTPDLTAVFELGVANDSAMMDAISGSAPFRAANWLLHRVRANTKRGSRRNIEAHYDLGNDFYRRWLDANMIYSSAVYETPEQSLEEAQAAKLRRVREKLQLDGAQSILEIGCGWGALAASIARNSAAKVTGVTISPSQLSWAAEESRKQGVDARVDLRLQDYRDVPGRFDRIVSIEMIEAVGREYIPEYFRTIRDRLKPGGVCVLQAITIAEDRFAAYCRRPDFIQRFIFPGGFLPTKTMMREAVTAAGMTLQSVETFGDSYAMTLRDWRSRFLAAWPDIATLGFTPSFQRLWSYYLCYCEAGFRSGAIDVGLYAMTHADPAS